MGSNGINRTVILDRIKGAIFGAIIADSLAFPCKSAFSAHIPY